MWECKVTHLFWNGNFALPERLFVQDIQAGVGGDQGLGALQRGEGALKGTRTDRGRGLVCADTHAAEGGSEHGFLRVSQLVAVQRVVRGVVFGRYAVGHAEGFAVAVGVAGGDDMMISTVLAIGAVVAISSVLLAQV